MSKTDDTANSKPAFLDFLRPKRESVTEDEIKDMVAENIELLEDEKRMINDILDLADMTVREIMKPRVDMIMAEDTEPARAALDRMRGTGYSRLPVYHEEVDEVIGLVSYKDLIGPLLDGRIEDPVAEFMYEPLYVPETKNVLKLLSELQEARMQLAIVVDEYGGTDGLINMEDIIEEIVGEIADETDNDRDLIVLVEPNQWRVDGRFPVGDAHLQVRRGVLYRRCPRAVPLLFPLRPVPLERQRFPARHDPLHGGGGACGLLCRRDAHQKELPRLPHGRKGRGHCRACSRAARRCDELRPHGL